jgi:hypothetical protein
MPNFHPSETKAVLKNRIIKNMQLISNTAHVAVNSAQYDSIGDLNGAMAVIRQSMAVLELTVAAFEQVSTQEAK